MTQRRIHPPAFCLRNSPFGPVAVLWSVYKGRPQVGRILLSGPENPADQVAGKIFPGLAASSSPEIDKLLDQMEAFFSGEDIRFSLNTVRMDLCTTFQQRVLLAEFTIPRGRVSTYKGIAEFLKNPRGARAVGTALANNPFPIVIPCHRAIRSDGSLGGFQYGLEMKRRLLEMEGVSFQDSGHVATRDFFVEFGAEKNEERQ